MKETTNQIIKKMGNLCCASQESEFVDKDSIPTTSFRNRKLRTRKFMGSLTDAEKALYFSGKAGDTDSHRTDLLKRIGIYDPEAIWVAQENKVILPTI